MYIYVCNYCFSPTIIQENNICFISFYRYHMSRLRQVLLLKINLQFQNALIFNGIQIPLIKPVYIYRILFLYNLCTLTGDSAVKYYHFF